MAALTNDSKPGGLEQQKPILSEFWRPGVCNQFLWAEIMVSAGLRSLQRLCGRILPGLFQLSVASGTPRFVATVLVSTPRETESIGCVYTEKGIYSNESHHVTMEVDGP